MENNFAINNLNDKPNGRVPFFSIIVPVYNHAWCLPATLDSILSQTYSNWEAVIINDGSTDGSGEIIEQYTKKDPRFRGFSKENGGVSTALNSGIKKARANWICWLSSDDFFEKTALSTFYEEINANPEIKFFHSDYYLLDDTTSGKNIGELDRAKNMPAKEWQTISLLQGNIVHGISIAVHKAVFQAVGLFNEDYRNGQDVDMWLRISNKYEMKFINKRTCITRQHEDTGTARFPEAGEYDAARGAVDFINKNDLTRIYAFIDVNNVENIVTIIRNAINAILNTEAFMYQGVGFIPALADRLREWISKLPGSIRSALKKDFIRINDNIRKSKLPDELKKAFGNIVDFWDIQFTYIEYESLEAMKSNLNKLEESGNNEKAGKIRRYLDRISKFVIKGSIAQAPGTLAKKASYSNNLTIFPESKYAHKFLDGLRGIEIGASAHNPFGLDTINVGIRDDIYEKEQMELTGTVAVIDIEATADDIPLEPESYDFVLSSHVAEHCPDLIRALLEWYRIVKKGGYIYMIVPHRDASPSDRDKPLTSWEHIFDDYVNMNTAEDEPEAGRFGHCHYHVFTLESLSSFVTRLFGARLELVGQQETDDKNGSGFTLVYRKTMTNDISSSWNIHKTGESTLVRLKGYTREHSYFPVKDESHGKYANIVMVTYNRLEFTEQAIESIVKRTHFPYTLTVIDNNSSDGTKEYLSGLKEKGTIKNLVLLPENVGVAKAANLGWFLEPDAEYLVKYDNDIVMAKDNWLNELVDAIETIPSLGAVSFNFEPVSYPLSELNGIKLRLKKDGNLGGACLLIPARTRDMIGYWCEDYGLYGEEDADYCYRIRLSSMQIAYMEDEDAGFHLPGGKAAAINPKTLKSTDTEEEALYPEYRRWKDERRRTNVKAGNYKLNMSLYKSRQKSLYCESAFAEHYLSKNIETIATEEEPPAAERYDISIIIPVYNKLELTQKCVETILEVTPRSLNYQLIIIDNASTDGTGKYIELIASMHGNIKYISFSENMGFAHACNQGIEYSDSKYILLLNNDTVPQPGWLEAMTEEICSGKSIGAVGSCLLYPDSTTIQHVWVVIGNQNNYLAPYHAYRYYDIEDTYQVKTSRDVNCVTAACLLLDREAVGRVGLFDEEYINGFEDVDYCIRLRQAGYRIRYCAQSRVYHYESMTENRNKNDIANWERLNHKWLGKIKWDESQEETLIANSLIDRKGKDLMQVIASKKEMTSEPAPVQQPVPQPAAQQRPAVKPEFSIIIPVHNNVHYTRKCIEGILKTKGINKIEIIVIDNASADETPHYLASLGSTVKGVRNETNDNYAKVNNQGAALASGRYLVFLNNDTEPFPGWLDAFKEEFELNSECAVQGAKLLYENGSVQHAGMVFGPRKDRSPEPYHAYITADAGLPFVNRKRKVQFVTGACLAIRKDVFDNLDGFDEEYVFGWEDTDLCMKINSSGLDVIYNPEAVLYHYESVTKKLREAYGDDMMNDYSKKELKNRERFFFKWGAFVVRDADMFYAEDGLKVVDNVLAPIDRPAPVEQAAAPDTAAAPAPQPGLMARKMNERAAQEMAFFTSFSSRFHKRNYDQASSVLIKCAAAIGDSLTVTAIAAELKRLHPHLTIFISGADYLAGIFDYHPDIESFLPEDSDDLLFIETNCDEVIDYNYIIAKMPDYYNRISYMDIIGNIAGIKFTHRNIVYTINDEERAWAAEQLTGFIRGRKAVAVQFRTNKDVHRSYPYGYEVFRELKKKEPDIVFLNLGLEPAGFEDPDLWDCPVRNITDIRSQIALASMCDSFLTVDSAFFHVGHNLFRKPTMVIAGITNPLLIGNPSQGFFSVRNEQSQFLDTYWQKPGINDTMTGLQPEIVAAEFIRLCLA